MWTYAVFVFDTLAVFMLVLAHKNCADFNWPVLVKIDWLLHILASSTSFLFLLRALFPSTSENVYATWYASNFY